MNKVVWQPKHQEMTLMWQFKHLAEKKYAHKIENYQQLHDWSVNYPEQFWQLLTEFFAVPFTKTAKKILSESEHMKDARWFVGAELNYAQAILSRNDNHPAIISINENGSKEILTYHELREEVARCQAGLRQAGIRQGDCVAAILPNVSYTVIAFLATASIGAIWSSCSPDFGLQAAIDRLGQIEPKLLFIGDAHIYQGKKHDGLSKIPQLLAGMPSLKEVVVCPVIHPEPTLNDFSKAILWHDFIKPNQDIEFTPLPFDHPLYVLFSSGTTGKPKCIVHRAGGVLLQHLKELGLHTDIRDSDNLFFYTTCGWMMWNWMVSVLGLGATLTLYEGSPTYPNALRLFEIIESEKVTVFGTSAKFISTVEKTGASPHKHYSLNRLRCILSTGSPLLPKNYDFVYQQIKDDVQLSSISGGTDIVSCFALGNPLLPVHRGEIQSLGLGMSVEVFDDMGHSVHKQRGELVCTKPFPSMPLRFWHDQNDEQYQRAYFERFPGVWSHGDFAEITSNRGLIIYGRSDAVLNPGGVRIGTAEIYRQIEKIPEVIDSCVIGQNWEDDVRVVLFVQLQQDIELDDALKNKIRQTIRTNASPRHVPAKIIQVPEIPRTINNKIVELAVRQVVHGEPLSNLQSLANPHALDYFKNRKELQE